MNTTKHTLITALSGILLTANAMAQSPLAIGESLFIDFGSSDAGDADFSGLPDAAGPTLSSYRGLSTSGNWNSVNAGNFFNNLINSTGSATTIDFGPGSMGASDSFNGPAYSGQLTGWSGFDNTQRATALNQLASDTDTAIGSSLGLLSEGTAAMDFYGSADGRFQLQQVSAGQAYDLTFYGSKKFPTDDTSTTYNVYDDSGYTNLLASVTLAHGSGGTANTSNVATISNLIGPSNANNILYIQFTGDNGGTGYINAMSITAIPEPSTFMLFGIAGVALISLTRRRK